MNELEKKQILGLAIKREREKRGLTQDKLSNLINIDPTNMSNIENGKNFPSMATLCAIIETLRIEPKELLSFISYDSTEVNSLDLEIRENIKLLPDDVKQHINEIIKRLLK